MPLSIRDTTLDVYADDTTLSKISSWENVFHLTQTLNQDLKRLTSYSKENILKLLRLLKRAARIILDAERTASFVSLFNTLKWVLFYMESYVNRCTLIYKRLSGNTPEYINDLFIRNCDIHNRSTRFCELI